MSLTLSTTNQTRWKDSYASSAKLGLTLRANGEEEVQLYTASRALVQAGFDAPTVAPIVADGGAGTLGIGYSAYRYVYASSQYPNVEAIQSAGGSLFPKSNPSPASAVYSNVSAIKANLVTVTKTTRSDVDTIFIYRTAIKSTSAEAQALADAGEMFYVGTVANNGLPGTINFTDLVAPMQEQLELDNYTAPQFWLTVYEPPYFYGFGNPELIVAVTLAGTTDVVAPAHTFYAGRQNQLVTFDGITTGGFDQRGTFYFSYVSGSLARVSLTQDGAAAVIRFSGTTTMHVRGPAATLYRSKPNNPFAWGKTNYNSSDDGSVTREPELYAFPVGGGRGSAMAVLTSERLLKLDVENPNCCYVLNTGLAGTAGFEQSKRTLDRQYSVAAHHAQFNVTMGNGDTALAGLDAANACLVTANAGTQSRFGSEVVETAGSMVRSDDYPRLFHGVYDPNTELSLFWLKTATDANNLIHIDTCLCYHGPSSQWSTFRDFDITASAAVYDPVTLETIILVGDAAGHVAQAFADGVHNNLTVNTVIPRTFSIGSAVKERDGFEFTGSPSGPTPAAGTYFDIGDTAGTVRVWLNSLSNPVSPPAVPARGRLLEVPNAVDNGDISACAGNVAVTLGGDAAFTVLTTTSTGALWEVNATGLVAPLDTGTVDTDMSLAQNQAGTAGVTISSAVIPDPGAWALFQATAGSGTPYDLWMQANTLGEFDMAVTLDPLTNTVNGFGMAPGTTGNVYIGLINCEARAFFQPDQTRSGQVKEIWGTFLNSRPFARFYEEFGVTQYASDMPFKGTVLIDDSGNASLNSVIRDTPSVLTTSFGLKVVDRSYTDFQILGLDVKRDTTR